MDIHGSVHDLIKRSAKGDQTAFARLVDRHQQYAYALAFRMMANREEAEDIVQECFIRIWKHCERFDHNMKFTTWMYTIVMNLCNDRIKIRNRSTRIFVRSSEKTQTPQITDPDFSLGDENMMNDELKRWLEILAGHLPAKQRSVFVLCDLNGLEQEKAAAVLNMSKGRLKSNLYYARKAIRIALHKMDLI